MYHKPKQLHEIWGFHGGGFWRHVDSLVGANISEKHSVSISTVELLDRVAWYNFINVSEVLWSEYHHNPIL